MTSAYVEEGGDCPYEDCKGRMRLCMDDPCTCFENPPCSACVERPLECSNCGLETDSNWVAILDED